MIGYAEKAGQPNAIELQRMEVTHPILTPAMLRVLQVAASRERGNICPTRGVWAAAQTRLIEAMDRHGFIAWEKPEGYLIGDKTFYGAPRISEAGRAAVAAALTERSQP